MICAEMAKKPDKITGLRELRLASGAKTPIFHAVLGNGPSFASKRRCRSHRRTPGARTALGRKEVRMATTSAKPRSKGKTLKMIADKTKLPRKHIASVCE